MSRISSVAILSDIHYASAAEQARGEDYEFRMIGNPLVRLFLKLHRRFIWLHRPLWQNHLLEQFIERSGQPDYVVANGDYSCDTGFVGVSDEAAFRSASECLARLRGHFGSRFHATIGDHELGKFGFVGAHGGLRLASYQRTVHGLGLKPSWRFDVGRYAFIGVTSSLIALPLFARDMLPEERGEWERLRTEHLDEIRAALSTLGRDQRVLLFCHDPSALPFLAREDFVRERLSQVTQTIVGHLHSRAIFWKSRVLAGMPPIPFLGHTARRMTTALSEARHWKAFHPILCPSLSGLELFKDGGFLTATIDESGSAAPQFKLCSIRR